MEHSIKFYLAEIAQAAIEINSLGETAGFKVTPVYDGEKMTLSETLDRLEIAQACLLSAQAVLAKFNKAYFEELAEMMKAQHKQE